MPKIKLIGHTSYGIGGKTFKQGTVYDVQDEGQYERLMALTVEGTEIPMFKDADKVKTSEKVQALVPIEREEAAETVVMDTPAPKKIVLGKKKVDVDSDVAVVEGRTII